jgi:hypothetical protein
MASASGRDAGQDEHNENENRGERLVEPVGRQTPGTTVVKIDVDFRAFKIPLSRGAWRHAFPSLQALSFDRFGQRAMMRRYQLGDIAMDSKLRTAWAPRLLSVLRIASGLCLLEHGTAKVLKFPVVATMAKIDLASMGGIAGFFELIGGALLLVGLFTRPVAFILSGMCAVAISTPMRRAASIRS